MLASNIGLSTSHNWGLRAAKGDVRTFTVWLKPTERGKRQWRFRFRNTVNSTFDHGDESWADLSGGCFEILKSFAWSEDADRRNPAGRTEIHWSKRLVEPDDWIESVPAALDIPEKGYLVFSWTLKALDEDTVLPSTPDSRSLNSISENENEAEACESDEPVVLPDAFEAERDAQLRMAFLGDSITQGCGTRVDRYEQWAARIASGIDRRVAVWNIGLGFGRAEDAARNGSWLEKAKMCDIVNVCFGINDLGQHGDDRKERLIKDLNTIVESLHKAEKPVTVVLFTIPAFDLSEALEKSRQDVNRLIREGKFGSDYVFDMDEMVACPEPDQSKAFFGGHPDGRGGAAIAGEYLSRFWRELESDLIKQKKLV